MNDELETTSSDDKSAIASLAGSVAKDLAVTVLGTVVGLGLLTASLKITNKIAAHRLAKSTIETVAPAM